MLIKKSDLNPSEKAVIRLEALGASFISLGAFLEVWLPQAAPPVLLECGMLLARLGPGQRAGLEALRLEPGPRLRARIDTTRSVEVPERRKQALARLNAFAKAEPLEPDPATQTGVGARASVPAGLPAEQLVLAGYLITHAVDWPPEPGAPLALREDEGRLSLEIAPRGLTREELEGMDAKRLLRRFDECLPGWRDKLQIIDELTTTGCLDLVIGHELTPLRKVEFGFRLARLTDFAYPFGFDGPDAPVRLKKWYPHGLRFRLLPARAAAAGAILKGSPGAEGRSRERILTAFGELVTLKAGVQRAGNCFYVRCGDAWLHGERFIAHVWTGFLLAQLFEGPYEQLRIDTGDPLTFVLPIVHLSDLDLA